MDTSVIFELGLKEYMTQGLRKVGATAKEVFGEVEKAADMAKKRVEQVGARIIKPRVDKGDMDKASEAASKAKRAIEEIGLRPVKVNIDTSELDHAERKVQRLKNSIDGSGGSTRGGSMAGSMFIGSLAARGVEMGARKIFETGHEALGAGMDAEQQIIALKTFLGESRAKGLYAQLQKDSALTPFTTSQILPGMQQLIASGLTPEKSKKDIWSLMNALSATGNAGNAFSLELGESHLAQMAAVGKVDAYFMKEFQRTLHIPMTKLLADEMFPRNPKKGMKQIAEWTENGELKDHVTYDMFVGALEKAGKAGGMFAGALEAQSQTIKGKASTIKDWWNIGMAKSVLDPNTHSNIIKLEDRLISGLEGLPELIGKISPVVNTLFDRFNDLVPSLKEFGSGVYGALKPIGQFVLSESFTKLTKDLLGLSAEITNDVMPVFKTLGSGLTKLAEGSDWLINRIKGEWASLKNSYLSNYPKPFVNESDEHARKVRSLLGNQTPEDRERLHNTRMALTGQAIDFLTHAYPNGWGATSTKKNIWEAGFDNPKLEDILPKRVISANGGKNGGSSALEKELGDSSAAIVGGGPKQTIIKLNNLVGAFTLNNNGTAADGRQQTEEWLTTLFLRLMRSVPG